jgi:hypothetical protein
MAPSNDGDVAVSPFSEPSDAIDRSRLSSPYISNGAKCENGTQHNGHNYIEISNHHANNGTVNYIRNNYYHLPTDSPSQAYEPIPPPEGSCERHKTLREQFKILQKHIEMVQEQCNVLQMEFQTLQEQYETLKE